MGNFMLRFTDIDNETGEYFSTYETENHGWRNVGSFLSSVKRKNGQKLKNGYSYIRCDGAVTTKVEAV